jgi:hypothetical protein
MLSRAAAVLKPYHSAKSTRLAKLVNHGGSRYGPFNWYYDEITRIEALGEGENYGIEIEGTHTHVTNGLVTHNTRQFQVLDICRMYRVPPHKLAEYGRATFNNIEQQQQAYIDDCLGPPTDQLEGLMDDQLLFEDERDMYGTHFDFTGLLRGDQIRRYQAYGIGLGQGFLSRNEVRAFESLNPIPDGDQYIITAKPGETDPPLPSSGGEGDGDGGDEE